MTDAVMGHLWTFLAPGDTPGARKAFRRLRVVEIAGEEMRREHGL
jgi:hypothetical protein